MQSVVAALPKQAPVPAEYGGANEPRQPSGFFNDVSRSLPRAELAAVLALAVHRRLIEEPVRQQLAVR
jgi:hypothetical protein